MTRTMCVLCAIRNICANIHVQSNKAEFLSLSLSLVTYAFIYISELSNPNSEIAKHTLLQKYDPMLLLRLTNVYNHRYLKRVKWKEKKSVYVRKIKIRTHNEIILFLDCVRAGVLWKYGPIHSFLLITLGYTLLSKTQHARARLFTRPRQRGGVYGVFALAPMSSQQRASRRVAEESDVREMRAWEGWRARCCDDCCRDDIVRWFVQRDREQRRSLTFWSRARTSSPRTASVRARDFCASRRCWCRRNQ